MKKNVFVSSFILLSLFFVRFNTFAKSSSKKKIELARVSHVSTEPVIDGRLDDEVWARDADIDAMFKSYSPTFGELLPYKTRIWLANDLHNLYFAFHCLDSEPEKIKSSITRRDDMWKDDWIGFNIDTIGNKRFGYVLCSNPKGIQGDLYDSSASGVDFAPDYVWYSTGKVVEDGYIVEMKIPLDGFKYKSGKNVKMNVIFERKITRLGVMGSWPEVPPGQGFFAGMTTILLDELSNQPNFLAIPAFTYGNIWDKKAPLSWSRGDSSTQMGITAKYSFASSISTEATINPDFSQIESDEFQILVNQRYPIFYSEKRPFFMEISKIFSLAGSGVEDENLVSAVHTRKIVDPSWGVKLAGELDALSFGFLTAIDTWPGREYGTEGNNPFEGKKALYVVGRSKLGIGSDNYIGGIIASRDFAEGYNRAVGWDLFYRFKRGNSFLRSYFLHTITKDETNLNKSSGSAFTLSYEYSSKPFNLWANYEYFDDDFRMDTAFVKQLGISKFTSYLDFNLYPDKNGFLWLKRMTFFIYGYYLRDIETQKDDYVLSGGIKINLTRQGQIKVEYSNYREFWRNIAFRGNFINILGQIQPVNWINLSTRLKVGDSIYYDPLTPYSGKGVKFDFNILIQPSQNLAQYFQYIYQKMKRKQDGLKLYNVNILISRTTYQINKYLFLKAIIQYDSYLGTILTDGLISYTLIPGTVLHLGYGGLSENVRWREEQWFREGPFRKYVQTKRSIFFKVSYLFRF